MSLVQKIQRLALWNKLDFCGCVWMLLISCVILGLLTGTGLQEALTWLSVINCIQFFEDSAVSNLLSKDCTSAWDYPYSQAAFCEINITETVVLGLTCAKSCRSREGLNCSQEDLRYENVNDFSFYSTNLEKAPTSSVLPEIILYKQSSECQLLSTLTGQKYELKMCSQLSLKSFHEWAVTAVHLWKRRTDRHPKLWCRPNKQTWIVYKLSVGPLSVRRRCAGSRWSLNTASSLAQRSRPSLMNATEEFSTLFVFFSFDPFLHFMSFVIEFWDVYPIVATPWHSAWQTKLMHEFARLI